jgi:hypothetical protein
MATWTITSDLRVLYDSDGKRQDCGKAETALLPELESWVAREASVWDVVRSPSGLFVRQDAPMAV